MMLGNIQCCIVFTATQGDGTTAQLGSNAEGKLGPFTLSAGWPASNYSVNLTVRIFDNLGAFNVSSIVPGVQVNIHFWIGQIPGL